MNHVWLKSTLTLAIAGLLLGCNSNDSDAGAAPITQPKYPAIEFLIAHINDHHSHLEPIQDFAIEIDGTPTQVELGGLSRIANVFKALENDPVFNEKLLKLHAGDAITGTTYYSFFKGKVDADMMNSICFDAFALGNHEFDDGDQGLVNFLDHLNADPTCQTPTLAANVIPKLGTPLAMTQPDAYIKPYTIKTMAQGVKVGIIGIDIADKTSQSSRPLDTTKFLDEVATTQKYIDELKQQGIQHIIALTHQGYQRDIDMAKQLTGIDVIIGGDSHSLLGDFSRFGLESEGAYPTLVKNKEGNTVCIGQAWEYSKAIGLMDVQFNTEGNIASCGGKSVLVIGDSFKQANPAGEFVAVSSNQRTKLLETLKAEVTQPFNANILDYVKHQPTENILDSYRVQIEGQLKIKIGTINEPLCLMRVPGTDNRSAGTAGCENANSFARGSDIAQVVAEAFLQASRLADISLQNAGGVRIPVGTGELTNGVAREVLPFSNTLVEMRLTGQQLVNALEDGVATGSGAHPYAAGMRWDLDLRQPKGKRISNVEVKDRNSGVWSPISLTQTYTLVTNDFIASGRDGYTTLGEAYSAGNFVDTFLLYTDSFIDYVKQKGSISRLPRSDYSHKTVISADGTVLNSN
ncbi:MAG: 5'-nucleotidase C-terminal domain-containing protein [Pseudomonadota bacterium]|nr:5'-nucleotidase C-terminal domain-containing protein [Pseudomonadota bacterium]